MKVITFAMSPRTGGNSETLLDEVIAGLHDGGIDTEKIRTHEAAIEPCRHCGACQKTGRCVIEDSFQDISARLVACAGVVFASPLFFMNVPARGKALIDRCQSFWAARYQLGIDLFGTKKRHGLLVSCGAQHHGPDNADLFRGVQDTFWAVFRALAVEPMEPILIPGVERFGAVGELPDVMRQARLAGGEMARRIAAGEKS